MNFLLSTARIVKPICLALLLAVLWQNPLMAQSVKGKNSLQGIQDRHKERFREFSGQIEKLAQFCDEK